jgi:hypothetical protein
VNHLKAKLLLSVKAGAGRVLPSFSLTKLLFHRTIAVMVWLCYFSTSSAKFSKRILGGRYLPFYEDNPTYK